MRDPRNAEDAPLHRDPHCAWCGKPMDPHVGPKGGRPRKYHPECKDVRDANELLQRAVRVANRAGYRAFRFPRIQDPPVG